MNNILCKVFSIALGTAALVICSALKDELENEVQELCDFGLHDI